ncbi:hypothetical protein Airi01_043120 [Actinoallomurus iriomotensis]|uniref:Uncharacterized protein n=1 Tax=Actinoallomurus iriomotensis TaxID=478107 RepID=A0A9W6RLH5_9ACTN|nr:hypothetical protein Airi01_043120 [Actinoallomurus iriomotensis]
MDDTTLVSRFLRDGFVRLEGTVAPRVVADCARLLWRETGCDPDDPSTWTRPVHWVGGMAQGPFAAAPNSPPLHHAYDLLVGAGRWEPRYSPVAAACQSGLFSLTHRAPSTFRSARASASRDPGGAL